MSKWQDSKREGPPISPGAPYREQGGHLQIYFGWPIIAAGVISTTIALSRLGMLCTRELVGKPAIQFSVAWGKSVRTFFVLLPVQVVLYSGLAAWVWGGPRVIERIRHPVVAKPQRAKEKTRVVPVYARGSQKEVTRESIQDKLAAIGQQIGDHIWPDKPATRGLAAGRFSSDTKKVVAKAASPALPPSPGPLQESYSALEELYDVTHDMHHVGLPITREHFMDAYIGGQGIYAKYKDIWLSLGWIELDGRGAIAAWTAEEHELYLGDRGLTWMARHKGFPFPPTPPVSVA